MPWGTASLLRYHDGVISWIDPALYLRNVGEFDGQIQGLAGDDQWLYAIINNSTKVEVLAGRDTPQGWIWHGSLAEITLTGCQSAHVSSVSEKRLYIPSTTTGENLYYQPLYANYGDVTNDANRSYDTGASPELHTPKLHGNFRGDTKAFIKAIAELGHTPDDDIYYECHYQIQGDTTWTDAGDFKASTSTGDKKVTLYIPDDSSSNHPSSEWIRFKLVAKTDAATKTPILKNFDVRGILYPPRRKIIQCVVKCANDIILKDGAHEIGMRATIKTALENADGQTWPVSIRNIDGDTKTVRFLPLRFEVTKTEKLRDDERDYFLTMQEVALS